MLRIFKTAINTPLINQSNTCNCVYVMSRSFARRKKTDLTPREMQEMSKLVINSWFSSDLFLFFLVETTRKYFFWQRIY